MTNLPEPLLRPDEVAKFFSVHVNTIYEWVREGKVPGAKRIGGKIIRIPRSSVIDMQKNVEDEELSYF